MHRRPDLGAHDGDTWVVERASSSIPTRPSRCFLAFRRDACHARGSQQGDTTLAMAQGALRRLARRHCGQRRRHRRAGRRNGGKAGRPGAFRLRPARRADGCGKSGSVRRSRPRGRSPRLSQSRARFAGGGRKQAANDDIARRPSLSHRPSACASCAIATCSCLFGHNGSTIWKRTKLTARPNHVRGKAR